MRKIARLSSDSGLGPTLDSWRIVILGRRTDPLCWCMVRRSWGRVLRSVLVLSAALIVAMGWSGDARAAAPGSGATYDEARVNYEPPPAERRDGIAMGLQYGIGLGSFAGYPMEVAALNDPSQRVSTGLGLATSFSFWLGGALRDFLTFGLGVTSMSTSGSVLGVEPAFLVHIETFPLFHRGGVFRDLGLAFDGGLGIGFIGEKGENPTDDPLAEGGAMSTLGFSTFWEPLRFWHFSAGPSLAYVYSFSQTLRVHQGTIGFRMALYGVQPKQKKQSARTGASASF